MATFRHLGVLSLGLLCLGIALPAVGAVTEFGETVVGSAATADVTVPLTLAQLAAAHSFSLHYGVDYQLGSCAPVSGGCQVPVTFSPHAPGSSGDAIVVKDSSNSVITRAIIHGTGTGGLGVFNPGVVSLRDSNVGDQGIAVDPNGVIYFGNANAGAVYKLAPGATTPVIVATGFPSVNSLALDWAGNLYLTNYTVVAKVDAETGTVTNLPIPTCTLPSPSPLMSQEICT